MFDHQRRSKYPPTSTTQVFRRTLDWRTNVVFASLLAASFCMGCRKGNEEIESGPPRDLPDIVSAIQANADRVDRPLWAGNVNVTARVKDDRGKRHSYNLEGSLLFDKPRNLRMDLRPGLGDQVMGLGSNDQEYWVWIEPEMKAMHWGRHRYADQPCARSTGIRVDQLVGALGMGGLPSGSEGLSGPTRREGKKHDILEYRRSGGVAVDREYWVSRAPPYQIHVVNFRDAQRRIVMSAMLEDYEPAWQGGPLVPRAVSMIWPQEEGKFTMRVSRLKGMEPGKVAPTAFVRPDQAKLPKGVAEIIQVDADCGP
ncbi:MAG TPA: hypothetical protein VJZ71_14160 [Phycisphaerae bacterium]|nr:hypothetical protein [Phycisphaerae bacterium]